MLHMQARRIVHATLPVPHSNPIHQRLQEDSAGVGKTVTSSECSLPKNKGCLKIQQHSRFFSQHSNRSACVVGYVLHRFSTAFTNYNSVAVTPLLHIVPASIHRDCSLYIVTDTRLFIDFCHEQCTKREFYI